MNHVFFHLELQSGSSCQLPDGKPMARMSIIGYLSSNAIKLFLNSLLLQMMSTKCFKMQRVKNTLLYFIK